MTEQNEIVDDMTGATITLKGHEYTSDTVFHGFNNGEPILKLCANGDIFVKGKKVVNDIEVVEGMRELLKLTKD